MEESFGRAGWPGTVSCPFKMNDARMFSLIPKHGGRWLACVVVVVVDARNASAYMLHMIHLYRRV